jgi:hypothetical protein
MLLYLPHVQTRTIAVNSGRGRRGVGGIIILHIRQRRRRRRRRSSRIVSVDVIRRISRIVIQNEITKFAYTARRVDVSIILVSGENYGKKWMKILSLAGEREGDIFREEKIQKERNLSRGPMTKGHLSERSFLDLIQMREIGTKKIF